LSVLPGACCRRPPGGCSATEPGEAHHDALAVAGSCARACARDANHHAPSRFASAVGARGFDSLLAIVQCGSEPRAAALLEVSQPTVHRTLDELEHLVGVPMFQRTLRGTRLTEAGEVILRGVKLALAEIGIAEDELAAFGGKLRGRVIVGALPLSAGYLVPRAIDATLKAHPGLQVTVVDGTYDSLIAQLRCADVDLIIGALRSQPVGSDIAQEVLFEDRLSVVVRAGHPLANSGGNSPTRPMRLLDLIDQHWILPLPHTPARGVFERTFAAEGLAQPSAQLQANSPSVVRALLLDSDRLALLSPTQVDYEIRRGLLVELPITLLDATRLIGVAMRRDGAPAPGTLALVAELRRLAASLSRIRVNEGTSQAWSSDYARIDFASLAH
jgi:LysR family transcriptional regulator of gallate degradation